MSPQSTLAIAIRKAVFSSGRAITVGRTLMRGPITAWRAHMGALRRCMGPDMGRWWWTVGMPCRWAHRRGRPRTHIGRRPWAHMRMRRWHGTHILPTPWAPVVTPCVPHPLALLPGVTRPGHAGATFGPRRRGMAVPVVDHGFVAVVVAVAVFAFDGRHHTTGKQHACCQHSAPAHR